MQKHGALVILFAVAGFLRLWHLGYSDYQGDEIKALYNPKEASSVKFFLDQRKGPVQFIVTAGLKNFSPDYRNRLLLRLPFALAGFGSVVVFYYLTKALFGERIAFYSSIFFATNGFFIAFSRIVQYQSFVIFFGLLAVYLAYRATNQPETDGIKVSQKLLLAGFACWAVSILSHYDGIFFGPIIAGILLSAFVRQKTPLEKKSFLKLLVLPTLVFMVLNGLFYIPFALNLAQSTADYWAGRISGSVSGKISSTRYLFSVYQPIYVLHIYTILGILGFFLTLAIFIFKLTANGITNLATRLPKLAGQSAKPVSLVRAHTQFSTIILGALLAWFALPFIALEAIISIPGTHIYTYLIPAFLFLGFALFHLELIVQEIISRFKVPLLTRFSKMVFVALVWLLFAFMTLQSHYIFVDHEIEYPWENKQFFLWTLPKPSPIYHLSVFGFPYYRHWDKVGDDIKSASDAQYYSTNERESIARYHISLQKSGPQSDYYVFIYNPQTFTNAITNTRVLNWINTNPPIVEYFNNDVAVTRIYRVTSPKQ